MSPKDVLFVLAMEDASHTICPENAAAYLTGGVKQAKLSDLGAVLQRIPFCLMRARPEPRRAAHYFRGIQIGGMITILWKE